MIDRRREHTAGDVEGTLEFVGSLHLTHANVSGHDDTLPQGRLVVEGVSRDPLSDVLRRAGFLDYGTHECYLAAADR
jgi:hypothetical protein